MRREFIVTDGDAGMRLDKFLAAQMPEFSRSEIQKFSVLQNGAPVKMSARIRAGDAFVVEVVTPQSDTASDNISSDFDLDILFEDDDIIVVNKPDRKSVV